MLLYKIINDMIAGKSRQKQEIKAECIRNIRSELKQLDKEYRRAVLPKERHGGPQSRSFN